MEFSRTLSLGSAYEATPCRVKLNRLGGSEIGIFAGCVVCYIDDVFDSIEKLDQSFFDTGGDGRVCHATTLATPAQLDQNCGAFHANQFCVSAVRCYRWVDSFDQHLLDLFFNCS